MTDRTKRSEKRTPKYKIGGKVRCTHAASSAYRTGDVYDVVKHPQTEGPAIKALDGFLDLPSLVVSTFEPFTEDARGKLLRELKEVGQ